MHVETLCFRFDVPFAADHVFEHVVVPQPAFGNVVQYAVGRVGVGYPCQHKVKKIVVRKRSVKDRLVHRVVVHVLPFAALSVAT